MMFRSTSIVLAIASLLIAASRSNAQSSACGGSTGLTLSAGVGQNDRVDATASPFQFRGRGFELAASVAKARGRLCIIADGDGGTKSLASSEGTASTERLLDVEAGIAAFRDTPIHFLSVGAEVRGLIAITDHSYTDPRHVVATYRVGAASLGPAVRWHARLGRGSAALQLSSPAIALVDHPYVAVWTTDPEPTFRVATFTRFRGVHGTLSYAWTAWCGVGSVVSYRVSGVRYDDVHPLRALSQSLSLGARVPLDP